MSEKKLLRNIGEIDDKFIEESAPKRKDKISIYNKVLQETGLIEIKHYRDELGHTRNIYKIKCI